MRNRIGVLAALPLLLVLAGCGGLVGATPTPTPTTSLAEELADLPGVLAVQPSGDHVLVDIRLDADDATVLAAAEEASILAAERSWAGEVIFTRERGGLDPATDLAPLPPWSETVYPGDPTAVRATLSTVLAIERVPDVVSIGFVDGWPSVVLASLPTFAESFRTLSALPAFADGATYSYVGEQPRLRVVHLPERMTPAAIEAVIRIAVENPEAEVELQSLTSPGNRWPELWVARLTEEQRDRVDAQLRDPSLATADPEGYAIPFQLSVLGPGGPVLSWGTFGDVPDSSS